MKFESVEQRNGGYYVAGTRISLDSVVCAFNHGDSPERILERFPLVGKASRVYGAIAYYLDHKERVDACLEASEREFEAAAGPPLTEANLRLWAKLQAARAQVGGPVRP